MQKINQLSKELTASLESFDLLRNLSPIIFAILGIVCLCIEGAFPAGIVFLTVAGCMGGVWISVRKYYRQIALLPDRVQVYTRGGKLKRELLFSDFKISRQDIVLDERYDTKCDALILYRDMELYEGMILHEYLNDKNILIITNREAIASIEKQLNLGKNNEKAFFAETTCDHVRTFAKNDTTNITAADKQYALLSREIAKPNLITKKYVLFLIDFICFPIVLAFIDVIYLLMLVPLSILAASSVLLHFSPNMYQRYAVVSDNSVIVYSRNGEQLQIFHYSEVQAVKRFFYAEGVYFAREEECLILYRGGSLPTKEKFSHYWNNKDILYISNPELISLVEKHISKDRLKQE